MVSEQICVCVPVCVREGCKQENDSLPWFMTCEKSASIKYFDLLFKTSFTHEPTSLAKADWGITIQPCNATHIFSFIHLLDNHSLCTILQKMY